MPLGHRPKHIFVKMVCVMSGSLFPRRCKMPSGPCEVLRALTKPQGHHAKGKYFYNRASQTWACPRDGAENATS